MPEGILYGLIDNGVLAFVTLLGIDIDKYFKGSGVNGALYGALIGNSLSDFLGAIVDFSNLISAKHYVWLFNRYTNSLVYSLI